MNKCLINNEVDFVDLSVMLDGPEPYILTYDKNQGIWYGYYDGFPLSDDIVYDMIDLPIIQKNLNAINFYDVDFV